MSCDWHIRCVTCGDTHRFDDANHMDEAMSALIRHRDAIAALVPLLREPHVDIVFSLGLGNRCDEWRIDPAWFAKHAGHELRPIDEYGCLLGQCGEHVRCGECSSWHLCALEHGHAPPCVGKPRTA